MKDLWHTLWNHIGQLSNTASRSGYYAWLAGQRHFRRKTWIGFTSNGSICLYNSSMPTPSTVLRHSWQSIIIFLDCLRSNFLARRKRLQQIWVHRDTNDTKIRIHKSVSSSVPMESPCLTMPSSKISSRKVERISSWFWLGMTERCDIQVHSITAVV